jgi:hypothetical protein
MAGALSAGFKALSDEERERYTAKAKEQKDKCVHCIYLYPSSCLAYIHKHTHIHKYIHII